VKQGEQALSAPSNAPGLSEGLERLGSASVTIGMQRPGGALAATRVRLARPVTNGDTNAADSTIVKAQEPKGVHTAASAISPHRGHRLRRTH
jgi:hypothetical protein